MVKKRYKQTEIGVIPEDWDVCSLELLSKLSSGTTPSRSQEDRYYRNGEHHWVKTTDLNNSRITTTEEKVTKAALDETGLQIYPPGTVFVAMYGGFNQIGRTGLLAIPAAVNQALVAIQTKSSKLDSTYLLATLNYRVEHWKSVASSSRKDPNITSQDVRNFILPIPNVEEQRSIATALSDVDTLIASLDKLIAKKRAIKTATMQQLLTGKKRLPGFGEGKGYKKTEVGLIPKDWDASKLEQITNLIIDGTHHTPQYTGYGIPFLRVTDLQFSTINLESLKFISLEEHQLLKQRCNPEPGDLLLSKNGTIGLTKVVEWDWEFSIFVSLALIKVKKENLNVYYLDQFFKSNFLYDQLKKRAKQGTVTNLHLEEIRELIIPVPSNFTEQRSIVTVLSDMDTEIVTLEARRTKTQAIKQGMMQELLTGRTQLV